MGRGRCIATFRLAMRLSKRSIGQKWKRWPQPRRSSPNDFLQWRPCEHGCSSTDATKQIIGPALNSLVGGPSRLYEGSRTQIQGAIDSLVKRAIKNGDIRRDLEPFDLLRALIGVSHVASGPDWQQSARRLVDILITGSRPVN